MTTAEAIRYLFLSYPGKALLVSSRAYKQTGIPHFCACLKIAFRMMTLFLLECDGDSLTTTVFGANS